MQSPIYTADEFEQASRIVYAAMPPTPQYAWPLLKQATGCETPLELTGSEYKT